MDKHLVPAFLTKIAKRAPTFVDLAELAFSDIRTLNGKAEMVCGPITTGGFNDVAVNTLVFNHAIDTLQDAGRPMFSQMPYEATLADLEHEWMLKNVSAAYCHPILDEFYGPIFNSGLVHRCWFLPGWEKSTGAAWEHERCKKLGIDVRYLDQNWMSRLNLPDDLD